MTTRSYKVACWDKTGGAPAYNALRFVDKTDAEVYAKDLYSRWMGLDRWEVHESEDEPNKVFWHGRMLELFVARRFTVDGFFRRWKRYGPGAVKIALEQYLTARTYGWREAFALLVRRGVVVFEFGAKRQEISVVRDWRPHGGSMRRVHSPEVHA